MSGMIPDPTDETKWFIGSAAEPVLGFQIGDATLLNVHPPEKCAGRTCLVHNPSDHHMREWPLNWRGDSRVMERRCPHDQGHPDPDDVAYQKSIGRGWVAMHGCDGCCAVMPDAATNEDRDIHPSHDPEPDGVRLYFGCQACRRCCHFVAFESPTHRITDVGVAPCSPGQIAVRGEGMG